MKFYLTHNSKVECRIKRMEGCASYFGEIEIPIKIAAVDDSEENKLIIGQFREMVLHEADGGSLNISNETDADVYWTANLALICDLNAETDAPSIYVQFKDEGIILAIAKVAAYHGLTLTVKVELENLSVSDSFGRTLMCIDGKTKGSLLDYTKNYGERDGCPAKGKLEYIGVQDGQSTHCSTGKISVKCTARKQEVSFLPIFRVPANLPKARLVLSPRSNVAETILDQEILTDAMIKTEDNTSIKCHRSFLAAQSSVFRRMFENELTEAKTGLVEIPDISGEGAEALIRYLYFSCVTKPSESFEITFELLQAGHKYDIQPLEQQMAYIILQKPDRWMNVKTSINLYKFIRNLEEHESLKLRVVAFMKKNVAELVSSPQYLALFDEGKEAAMELCRLALSV